MQKLKLKLFILSLLLISSCSSVKKSYKNSSIEMTVKSPMIAKVDVDLTRKLVGYASGGFLFHIFHVSGDIKSLENIRFNGHGSSSFSVVDNVQIVKGAAAYNAISGSNADILVDPQYILEESHWNPFYKEIKVKVTGYAGKVVAIKNEN